MDEGGTIDLAYKEIVDGESIGGAPDVPYRGEKGLVAFQKASGCASESDEAVAPW